MNRIALAGRAPEVVVVCQVFHPESISTGQTLTELCEVLSGRGLRLTVIAAQPTLLPGSPRVPSRLEHRGMTILRTWSTRLPKTRAFGKAANLVTFFVSAAWTVLTRYRRAPLLLLSNPPYLPLLGWLAKKLGCPRFGVLLFDIMPEQAELVGFLKRGGRLARLWRRLNRLWYRKADYAVVLSHDMLEGALTNAGLLDTAEESAARAKTHVIHVWADDRAVAPMAKSESAEAQRLEVCHCFVVQYSGNHARFHDLETLLRLAACFGPADGFVFQFIGEGSKKKLVAEFIAAGNRRHVYSASYVPKERLAASLAMADLGVVAQLPGQERVCYPSKLLGIMAAARPVLAICPPNCEMARMIRQEDIGFVVPNGYVEAGRCALLEARSQPERLRLMGERAARLLRARFSLAKAAEAYFALLSSGTAAGPEPALFLPGSQMPASK